MLTRIIVVFIDLYRLLVSPLMPPSCRFAPSCSAYAREALLTHGLVRGGWLALRRIARCHPFSAGGMDPVPKHQQPCRVFSSMSAPQQTG